MTAETLTPIAHLAALIPSGYAGPSFADPAAATLFGLAPKKPSYGYDEPSEDDDGYDEDEDEEDEDEDVDDDEEDDEYSYDDEDDYDEDEDDEDEEDEDDEDEDEEDDDIGYYTLSRRSASPGGMNRIPLQ